MTDCKHVNTITDTESGEECCSGCGIVIEENRMVYEIPIVVDNGIVKSQHHPASYKMGDLKLGSVINQNSAAGKKLTKYQRHIKTDVNSVKGLVEFNKVSDKLNLPEYVIEEATKIFLRIKKKGFLRGREINATVAACLYLSSKKNGLNLTFKDICNKTGLNNQTLYSCYSDLMKKLELSSSDMRISMPEDYMSQIFSKLDLDIKARRKCIIIVKKFQDHGLHVGKNPIAIAAASVFIGNCNSLMHVSREALAQTVGVSTVTIRNTLRSYEDKFGVIV